MTRSELIARLALHYPNLTPEDVQAVVFEMFNALRDSLAGGNRVEIRGFGVFTLNYRAPQQARNPMTGEIVAVRGKCVLHFKPGKELRERVLQSAIPQRAPRTTLTMIGS
ncbi:MAG: HU family DNA-binding protein [Thiobacillaceae bacterium]